MAKSIAENLSFLAPRVRQARVLKSPIARTLLVFGVVAGLVLVLWTQYHVIWGPFIGGEEAEPDYFMNTMLLTRGDVPDDIDHPGIPLFLLGGAILFSLGGDFEDAESFLFIGHILTLAAVLITILLRSAWLTKSVTVLSGVAIILTFFVHPGANYGLRIWSPEALMLPMGALYFFIL